jgi:hypothetical protein
MESKRHRRKNDSGNSARRALLPESEFSIRFNRIRRGVNRQQLKTRPGGGSPRRSLRDKAPADATPLPLRIDEEKIDMPVVAERQYPDETPADARRKHTIFRAAARKKRAGFHICEKLPDSLVGVERRDRSREAFQHEVRRFERIGGLESFAHRNR